MNSDNSAPSSTAEDESLIFIYDHYRTPPSGTAGRQNGGDRKMSVQNPAVSDFCRLPDEDEEDCTDCSTKNSTMRTSKSWPYNSFFRIRTNIDSEPVRHGLGLRV